MAGMKRHQGGEVGAQAVGRNPVDERLHGGIGRWHGGHLRRRLAAIPDSGESIAGTKSGAIGLGAGTRRPDQRQQDGDHGRTDDDVVEAIAQAVGKGVRFHRLEAPEAGHGQRWRRHCTVFTTPPAWPYNHRIPHR